MPPQYTVCEENILLGVNDFVVALILSLALPSDNHPLILFVPFMHFKHEKFTSGLQFSKKPSNSETTTTTATSKSPTKTSTKTLKSPSGGKAADGVTSSTNASAKPADAHKGEERIGGERGLGGVVLCNRNCM